MIRTIGFNVKNLSDVKMFVNTGFDESDLLFIPFSPLPPPPTTTPQDETKDRKDDHSQNYPHDDPCDGPPRNTAARS